MLPGDLRRASLLTATKTNNFVDEFAMPFHITRILKKRESEFGNPLTRPGEIEGVWEFRSTLGRRRETLSADGTET